MYYYRTILTNVENFVHDCIINGDPVEAFEELWPMLESDIRQWLLRTYPDFEIEDMLQEAAIALWTLFKNPAELKGRLEAKPYPLKALRAHGYHRARYTALNENRRHDARCAGSIDDAEEEDMDYNPTYTKVCGQLTTAGPGDPRALWSSIADMHLDLEMAIARTRVQFTGLGSIGGGKQKREVFLNVILQAAKEGDDYLAVAKEAATANGWDEHTAYRYVREIKAALKQHYKDYLSTQDKYGKLTSIKCRECGKGIPLYRVKNANAKNQQIIYCSNRCKKKHHDRKNWEKQRNKQRETKQEAIQAAKKQRCLRTADYLEEASR